MSDISTIQNRINERITGSVGKDYPLQKFMDKGKYESLISTSSLYIATADRLSDNEEGFLFLQHGLNCIKYITERYKHECSFIPIKNVHSPYARCKMLLKQIFDFNYPRYMVRDGNGNFVRMEYDKKNGYSGLTYDDAMEIFVNDLSLLRSNTYITCFCSNTDMTGYMKQNYGDIVIVTTKNCLIDNMKKDISYLKFDSFPVMYIERNDFYGLQFYQNAIYDYNLFGIKRTQYAEEEEFRVQFSHKEPACAAPNHISVEVDLSMLIKKIIATNQSAYDFVAALNKQKGLNINLEVHS